jgi:hypothetical protein
MKRGFGRFFSQHDEYYFFIMKCVCSPAKAHTQKKKEEEVKCSVSLLEFHVRFVIKVYASYSQQPTHKVWIGPSGREREPFCSRNYGSLKLSKNFIYRTLKGVKEIFLSNEIMQLVGGICADIHSTSSEDEWNELLIPSAMNSKILKDALDLSWQNKYELEFLTIFKGIESEAKRILEINHDKEKPDKIIDALKKSGLISEIEFHFLNGLRALRNEIAHGKPEESNPVDNFFIQNEIKAGILLAILLLMRLQSKHDMNTVRI